MQSLMHRIRIKSFLDFDMVEQLNHITTIRQLRDKSLAESKIKKVRVTKSAKKNNPKKRQSGNKDVTKLAKAFAGMSETQIKNLLKGI